MDGCATYDQWVISGTLSKNKKALETFGTDLFTKGQGKEILEENMNSGWHF